MAERVHIIVIICRNATYLYVNSGHIHMDIIHNIRRLYIQSIYPTVSRIFFRMPDPIPRHASCTQVGNALIREYEANRDGRITWPLLCVRICLTTAADTVWGVRTDSLKLSPASVNGLIMAVRTQMG